MFLYFTLLYQQSLNIMIELLDVFIYFTFNYWLRFSYCLYIVVFMLTMDYAFRADTLTFAIKTEIQDLFLVMFCTCFFWWYSLKCITCSNFRFWTCSVISICIPVISNTSITRSHIASIIIVLLCIFFNGLIASWSLITVRFLVFRGVNCWQRLVGFCLWGCWFDQSF